MNLDKLFVNGDENGVPSIFTKDVKVKKLFCQSWKKCIFFIIYRSGSQPGVRVPLGVREEATGGTQRAHRDAQNSKNLTQMKLIWVEFFIWGNAKGTGVRRGVQFWFGGTRVPKGWEPPIYSGLNSCVNWDLKHIFPA